MNFDFENEERKKIDEIPAREFNLSLNQNNKETIHEISNAPESRPNLSPHKLALKDDNFPYSINKSNLDDSVQDPNKNEKGQKRSKSKNWNKLCNLVLGLNTFNKMRTKSIKNNESIDFELKSFERKYRLKMQNNTTLNNNTNYDTKRDLDPESIHELALQYLLSGENCIEKFDKIFNMDLETSKIENDFSKSEVIKILNSRMPNGKTLFYLACQDGNHTLVKYFLARSLNPSIKSRIAERELESCLEVACRWNFANIVELLLRSHKFTVLEISECLKINGITKNMRKLINKYLSKVRNSRKCLCF